MPEEASTTELGAEIDALTIHGISRISSAKGKISRMSWLILCISALTVMLLILVKTTVKYLKYETYVKTNTIRKTSMVLPAMTICHTNYYHPNMYAEEYPVFQQLTQNCSQADRKHFVNDMNWKMFNFACRQFFGNYSGNTATLSTESPKLFKFPTHFSLLPNKYPCFTLNRNATLIQEGAGEQYGIHMMLYFREDVPPVIANLHLDPLTDKRQGIYLAVHDHKEHSSLSHVILPAGFHTHVSLRKVKKIRKKSPYPSNCKDDGKQDKESIFPGKNTKTYCDRSCFYKTLYTECKGVLPEMRPFMQKEKYPLLANITDRKYLKCIFQFIRKFNDSKCNCHFPCEEDFYKTTLNRNPWPQIFQVELLKPLLREATEDLKQNFTQEDARNRLIKVSIYYEELTETVLQDEEISDFATILSQFGGQMGLFLGASLFSITEIIVLITKYAHRATCKKNEVRSLRNKEPVI